MVKFFSILLFLFSLNDVLLADQIHVVLKDQKGLYELGLNLDILEDTSSKLSIHDVNKKEWFDKFKRSEQKVPNFGGSSSAFWARLRIKNEANPKKEWFLSFNFYTQDEITFYKKKGLDWISIKTGDHHPFKSREIKARPFVFKIEPTEDSFYFLRIKGTDNQFDLHLADSVHFSSIEAKNNFAYGLLFGLILSMILYNFFIFVSTKSISYLYYIFYVLFFGLFISGLEGFNQRFLFHNNPWFSNNGQAFWMGLTQFFGALFTLSYLKMDKSMGVYYKALRLSCYIGFAISLSSFVLPFSFNLKAFILHGFFLIIAIFSSTLYRIKTKYRPAIYYILSMTLTLIGGGITALMPLGLVPSNFFVRNAFTIGNSIQFILLSMGLADRFNLIQEEALKNEKKAKKLQESYAKDLEKEVKKQTKTAVEEKEKAVKSEREVSGLLHNMKQAVFAIDREGIIIPPVSKFSQNIFEKEIQGQSIYETLFKDLEKGSELFNKIIFILKMCVGADSLQYDISADILPRKIIMKNNAEEKRSIQISYSPILDESDIVLKLMLVIEDVTELEALEKEVIESQEASAIKVQKMQEIVSNNKKEIKVFIREAILNLESAFKSIKGSQISEFLRAAHTLKGNSRIYNLSKLSEEIHHIETHLIQLKNNETEQNEGSLEKIYNQLNEKAYNYINLSKEIFGHDVDETVVVQGEDFFEIEKTIFFSTLEEVKKILNSRDMPDIIEMLKRIEYDEFKKSLFGLHKIINKISFALKKDLSLHIKGDEIYLDKKLTSIIKETLIHIIQNSADHGIKEKGNIEIIVLNKAKNYHITISDDGQGIDENIIYKKAIEKGLIKVEGTENFKKEDSLNLIFLPGFSTKNVATEFSGRGVGMDVVKTNIADLGGSIQIESEIGEGTLFKIEIPKPV